MNHPTLNACERGRLIFLLERLVIVLKGNKTSVERNQWNRSSGWKPRKVLKFAPRQSLVFRPIEAPKSWFQNWNKCSKWLSSKLKRLKRGISKNKFWIKATLLINSNLTFDLEKLCQKWDSNPRLQMETRTLVRWGSASYAWVWRLRPLGHPDLEHSRNLLIDQALFLSIDNMLPLMGYQINFPSSVSHWLLSATLIGCWINSPWVRFHLKMQVM